MKRRQRPYAIQAQNIFRQKLCRWVSAFPASQWTQLPSTIPHPTLTSSEPRRLLAHNTRTKGQDIAEQFTCACQRIFFNLPHREIVLGCHFLALHTQLVIYRPLKYVNIPTIEVLRRRLTTVFLIITKTHGNMVVKMVIAN